VKHFNHILELEVEREQRGKLYLEFLRVSSMSAGVYVLSPGSADPQKPHNEDELYYVVRGQGRMRVGTEERHVNAGSVIFVKANEEHRFLDVREELVVLVFFAPAES
jgi:mannose-6-phosphate isomerase-like protein (cupin superfamily)